MFYNKNDFIQLNFSKKMYLFVASLLFSVFASNYYSAIKLPFYKHLYSIAVSFSFTFFLYGIHGILTIICPSLFTWLLGYYIYHLSVEGKEFESKEIESKKNINKKRSIYLCVIGWIVIFGHLAYSHIYYMLESYMNAKNDIRTIQMLLVIKLTSYLTDIAYKVYFSNGVFEKELKYPELIEWFGYIFFIPSYFAGPVLQYDEYRLFILSTHDDTKYDNDRIRYYTTLLSVKGAVLLTFSLVSILYFDVFYLLDDHFASRGFMSKILILIITMTLQRCRFYFAWNLGEMAYILSGASEFVSHKGRNVHIMNIEIPRNTYTILNSWNISTNLWLKQYVYRPLIDIGIETQAICVFVTNLISAFWHGFYSGYYITFLAGGICTIIGRHWRRTVTQYMERRYAQYPTVLLIYANMKILIVAFVMNLICIPFLLYSYENTLKVLVNVVVGANKTLN